MAATSTFWLSHKNLISLSTIAIGAAGTVVLPFANMQDESTDTIARVTPNGSGAVDYMCTFPSDQVISHVALLGTNLPLGSTVNIQLLSNGLVFLGGAVVKAHTDASLGWPSHFVLALPTAVSGVRKIQITTASTIGVNQDFGGMWAGIAWKPEFGVNFEVRPQFVDPSEVAYSRGQQAFVNERQPYRQMILSFPALRESELYGTYGSTAENLLDIFFRNGARRRVLTSLVGDSSPYTDAKGFLVNRMAVYGLMGGLLEPQPFNRVGAGRVYRGNVTVRETL